MERKMFLNFAKKSKDPSAGVKIDSRYADAKGRLYFYDNAKFILIYLVVLAHAISPFQSGGYSSDTAFLFLWRIINIMHMPCMIFISGFFAKKYIRPDGSFNLQRPFTYLVIYLASQLSVGAFEIFVLKNSIAKSVLNPRSSLWFLACLAWWYMLLPVIDKFNPRFMLAISFAAGILVGYDELIGNYLSFSRMIVHFPFFLMGYYATAAQMEKIHTKKAKLVSIPVLIAAIGSVLVVMYLFSENGRFDFSINSFISCNKSYFDIFKNKGANPLFWALPRIWFYLCALGLSFAFLVWVPRRKNIFTKFGTRTLSVYIGHRFLYLAYNKVDGFNWASFDWFKYEWFGWKNILVLRIAMIVVSFIITVVLSLYPFYWPFDLLGKIKVKGLLKKNETK